MPYSARRSLSGGSGSNASQNIAGTAAVALADAPCDVALVYSRTGIVPTGSVLVPFGGGEHDWAVLLDQHGWLERDQRIGGAVFFAGVVLYTLAIGIGWWSLHRPRARARA